MSASPIHSIAVAPNTCPTCARTIALNDPPFVAELPCPHCHAPLILIRTSGGPTLYPELTATPIINRTLHALELRSAEEFHEYIVHATMLDMLLLCTDLTEEFGDYPDPPQHLKVPGDHLHWLIHKYAAA